MATKSDLEATLRQVHDVRQRTRAAIHPVWFILLTFGLLGLASIPFAFVGNGLGTGLFWLAAGPAGGVATGRYYRKRAARVGAWVNGRAYIVLGAAAFVAAWVGALATGSAAVPMLVAAVSYLGFARLERSWPVVGVAVVIAAASVVVAATDPPNAAVVLALVFGLTFTATGLVLRSRDRG